jgi:hypothetical protein
VCEVGLDLGFEILLSSSAIHRDVVVALGRRRRWHRDNKLRHARGELEGEELVLRVVHAVGKDKVALHVLVLLLALALRQVNGVRGIHRLAVGRPARSAHRRVCPDHAAAVRRTVLLLVRGDHRVAHTRRRRGNTGVGVREDRARPDRRNGLGLDARTTVLALSSGSSSSSSLTRTAHLAPAPLDVLGLGLDRLLGLGLAAIEVALAVHRRGSRLGQRRNGLNVNNARARTILVVRVHLDVRRVGLVPRWRRGRDDTAGRCSQYTSLQYVDSQFERDPPNGPAAMVLAAARAPPRAAPPRPRARRDGRPRTDADEISGLMSSWTWTARRTGILGLNFILGAADADADPDVEAEGRAAAVEVEGMSALRGVAAPLPLAVSEPVALRDCSSGAELGPGTGMGAGAGVGAGTAGLTSSMSMAVPSAKEETPEPRSMRVVAGPEAASGSGCDCAAATRDGRLRPLPGMRGRRGLTSRPDMVV